MSDNNVAFRVLVIVLLALGGFVFFPLFAVAALVGWALFKDLTDQTQPDPEEWFTRRWTVTAADPDWKSCFLPFCESPAEVAFLEAMIAEYGLTPSKGHLSSASLKLTLQTELKPYRVDFLVHEWLVVEIDGEAYHSSPEAVARDQARDRDLQARGFRIVRIRAKTVFNTPAKAIEMVCDAIASGRPERSTSQRSKQQIKSLGQVLSSLDKFITDVNSNVSKAAAVQAAMQQSLVLFGQEKSAIDAAFEVGRQHKEIQIYRAQSSDHAKLYDEAYAEIAALFDGSPSIETKTVFPIPAPVVHQDTELNAAIRDAHQNLITEREAYFESARQRLASDVQLSPLVRAALREMGHSELWHSISS